MSCLKIQVRYHLVKRRFCRAHLYILVSFSPLESALTFWACWHENSEKVSWRKKLDQHPYSHVITGNKSTQWWEQLITVPPTGISRVSKQMLEPWAANTSQTCTRQQTCRAAVVAAAAAAAAAGNSLHPQLSQDLIVTGMSLCLLPPF